MLAVHRIFQPNSADCVAPFPLLEFKLESHTISVRPPMAVQQAAYAAV